jgi:uncharacterized OB-fold protein
MQDQAFDHTGWSQHLAEGRLMAARCQTCGTLHLPPRSLCTHCFGVDMEWEQLSGQGKLAAFTWIHVGLPAIAAQGYDRSHPYCVGVVRLEEGPAVSAQILLEPGEKPGDLTVGQPLSVVWTADSATHNKVHLGFKKDQKWISD